jgi:hypothetical protein
MIPKSGYRFSEKIMLKDNLERDDDSKKVIPLYAAFCFARSRSSSS